MTHVKDRQPWHLANSLENVAFFVRSKAVVSGADQAGNNVLHHCAALPFGLSGKSLMKEILSSVPLELSSALNKKSRTPLLVAIHHSNLECAELFLQTFTMTHTAIGIALLAAVGNRQESLVRMLLNHPARDCNVVLDEYELLHLAARQK